MLRSIRVFCLAALAMASVASARDLPPVPGDELYRVDPPEAIVAGARALMAADPDAALVTVDASGQPRVRSVRAFLAEPDATDPRAAMTVWVMTREGTRKIAQVRDHPQVSLYFDDDAKTSYLSIMGAATVHTDPAHPPIAALLARKDLEGYAAFFWPEFPKGFVMIEVRPRWIEFMGPGVANHPQHWRPQAVAFPDE